MQFLWIVAQLELMHKGQFLYYYIHICYGRQSYCFFFFLFSIFSVYPVTGALNRQILLSDAK